MPPRSEEEKSRRKLLHLQKTAARKAARAAAAEAEEAEVASCVAARAVAAVAADTTLEAAIGVAATPW